MVRRLISATEFSQTAALVIIVVAASTPLHSRGAHTMRLPQVLSLVAALFLFLSGSAWGWQGHFGGHGYGGHGTAVNPNLLPRQAHATLKDDGRIVVRRTVTKPVYETRER